MVRKTKCQSLYFEVSHKRGGEGNTVHAMDKTENFGEQKLKGEEEG
jgi:hypothetical protein